MEDKVCFDGSDPAFAATKWMPRLAPPVLTKDRRIQFTGSTNYGKYTGGGPPVGNASKPKAPVFVQSDSAVQKARPTLSVDPPTFDMSARSNSAMTTPRTPGTPGTPKTPNSPHTPNTPEGWGKTSGVEPESMSLGQPAYTPSSPTEPPAASPPDPKEKPQNGATMEEDEEDEGAASSFAPTTEDNEDASNFAPGAEDDASNFAPGADDEDASTFAPGEDASSFAPDAGDNDAEAPSYAGGASYAPAYGGYGGSLPYQPGNGSPPAYQPSSPPYKPGSPTEKPPSPTYKPGSPTNKPPSPAYTPGSPPYKPGSPTDKPPSPAYKPGSPTYKPGSPTDKPPSPTYKPGSPPYKPGSPTEKPPSPAYKPGSPTYKPGSPPYQPGSPPYQPGSPPYKPGSPPQQRGRDDRDDDDGPPSFAPSSPGSPPPVGSSGGYTPGSPPPAAGRGGLGGGGDGGYRPGSPEEAPPAFRPASPTMGPPDSPPEVPDSAEGGGDGGGGGMSSFALKMMGKMGWQAGQGLGRNKQGVTEVIDVHDKQDRVGLGAAPAFGRERKAGQHIGKHQAGEVHTEVYVEWMEPDLDQPLPKYAEMRGGYVLEKVENCDCLGDVRASPTADYEYTASREVAEAIKQAKSDFDNMDRKLMRDAVQRANPWELVSTKGYHIFQNRAAMKMAEMDWLLNLTAREFSNAADNEAGEEHAGLFYFADICAGPGGFTEYMVWRRQLSYKGWGFTLKGDHDFRLDKFNPNSPPRYFKLCYGADRTGNIYSNDNMEHFAAQVNDQTKNLGLSLVTADGGDSVDGEFLRQEWIMRRLALCQSCTALMVLRKGGNFVCKLFDLFTPFLHDLMYLMYLHFEKTALVKPLTSRPANSERYLVCIGLRERRPDLVDFLLHINTLLDEGTADQRNFREVSRLVDKSVVPEAWTQYVREHNIKVGEEQIKYLKETMKFYEDPQLNIQDLQTTICRKLREEWGIPETTAASRALLAREDRPLHPGSRHAFYPDMFKFNKATDTPKPVALPPSARPVSGPSESVGGSFGGGGGLGGEGPGAGGGGAGPAKAAEPKPKPKKATGPDLKNDAILAALQRRMEGAKQTESKMEEKKRQEEEDRRMREEMRKRPMLNVKMETKEDKKREKAEKRQKGKKGEGEGDDGANPDGGGEAKPKKEKREGKKPKEAAAVKHEQAEDGSPDYPGTPATPPTPPPDEEPMEEVKKEKKKKRDRERDDDDDGHRKEKKHKKHKDRGKEREEDEPKPKLKLKLKVPGK